MKTTAQLTKKYELTAEKIINVFGVELFRIKSLISFSNVKIGELGGYVQKENNLSHEGNSWVSGDSQVSGDSDILWFSKVVSEYIEWHFTELHPNANL
jgi:hypothetical protein